MPMATTIPNLIKITVDTLEIQHTPKTLEESGIQVPSLVRATLQLCAKNLLCSSVLNHTGALNLVHKVQQRTLRATSIDSHYVAVAYTYMRHYALWLHALSVDASGNLSVRSASCDDKYTVL